MRRDDGIRLRAKSALCFAESSSTLRWHIISCGAAACPSSPTTSVLIPVSQTSSGFAWSPRWTVITLEGPSMERYFLSIVYACESTCCVSA